MKSDQQFIDDMVLETTALIYETAVGLYEVGGPSAVISWGYRVGLRFAPCEPCETRTPQIGDSCAVCGTLNPQGRSDT